MKIVLSLFIPLMAFIAICTLSSCAGTSNTSGYYSVETSLVEQTSAFDEAMPEEFLGGRTPWEEFYIDSQEYGYANVRQSPSKDSPVVKEIQTGEHFYGWRMDNNPDWIEVYDNDGSTVGYMFYSCARHTGNKSDEGVDYAETDYEDDFEDDYEDEAADNSYHNEPAPKAPKLSTKEMGWYYLKRNYPQFANETWVKYMPPEHEASKSLSDAIDIDKVTCATYQLKDGTTYVVFFTEFINEDNALYSIPIYAANVRELHGTVKEFREILIDKLRNP